MQPYYDYSCDIVISLDNKKIIFSKTFLEKKKCITIFFLYMQSYYGYSHCDVIRASAVTAAAALARRLPTAVVRPHC